MILKAFLATGKLGDIHPGLPKADVRRILGEPEDHSAPSNKREIWKYGSLQIAFFDAVVCFVGLYFADGTLVLHEALVSGGRIVIENTSAPNIERLLLENNLHYVVDEELTFDDQRRLLVAQSGVSIMFANGQLVSIQLSQTWLYFNSTSSSRIVVFPIFSAQCVTGSR